MLIHLPASSFKISLDAYSYGKVSMMLPQDSISPFQPTWLDIANGLTEHFLISDIQIGQRSQLLSRGAIPTSLFAKSWDLEKIGLEIAPMYPGVFFTMSISNTTDKPRDFEAQLLGFHLRDVPPDLKKMRIVGFGSTSVDGAANINVQPNQPFHPSHLFVPNHVLDDFTIDELSLPYCGQRAKASAIDLLPCNLRGDCRVTLPACDPMPDSSFDFLTIVVTNRAGSPKNFSAAILGTPTN